MIKVVGIDSKNLRIKCARRFGSDGPPNIGMDNLPQECTHDTKKVLEVYPLCVKRLLERFYPTQTKSALEVALVFAPPTGPDAVFRLEFRFPQRSGYG